MSIKTVFIGPDGTEHTDPKIEWLLDLIGNAGDSYWASGSGDAGLRFFSDEKPVGEMILVIRQSNGAFVQHLFNVDGLEYVLNDPALGQDEVTVKVGGNPWSLPRALFVSRSIASLAVQRFLQDGHRFESGNWLKF